MRLRLAALLSLLAAPALAADLTIGLNQYPATFHPLMESMAAKTYVLGMASRPVTTYDTSWRGICLLCEKLPSLADGTARRVKNPDGSDGIEADYTLKAGLSWGDGTPLTADDIRFTWQLARDPRATVSNADLFINQIGEITVKDARSFTIRFTKPYCDFATINDFVPLPAHLEKPVWDKDPAAYPKASHYATDPQNPGLWSGPYRIESVQPGAAVTLSRNPHWTGAQPQFDRVTVRTIEDSSAMSAALLAGDVDMIAGELGLQVDEAMALAPRLDPARFTLKYQPSLVYEHLELRLDEAPLSDKRVRTALLMALDRKTLVDQLFGGHQTVAASFVNPQDPAYAADLEATPFDKDRAATLLDEAGWTLGEGGLRRDAAGAPLTLPLATTAGNKSRELVQQVLQAEWAGLGVTVNLDNQPPRVLFAEGMTKRKFHGMALFAWMSAPASVPKSTQHSSQIPSAANGHAGQNYGGWTDPEADRLIEALETTCEDPARKALWRDLQARYIAELPALPLFFRASPFVLPAGMTGLVPTGHQYPTTYWIEDWRRP